ncbi:restriction endonuclease subunit S [Clostridium chromiireducens]|uniref:Restriction endonuclease subunit S n=1 Tax=Clostridium chromiireducens TaxID=225345 RepID=A0A964RNT5_9CLOT|nr:restriction endonuclease subunit S [Clostridium chromiireducens]MVX64905.1 restriction endonuclease subunit S [Clostridium chromiireducens]
MEYKKLEEVCSIITDGTHQTPIYSSDGYIFLSSKNVTSGKIDWDNVKYINEELHNELSKRLKPQRNDILLAKNGTTGIGALVDRDINFDIYVSLALLRPIKEIYPPYLLYMMNSPNTKQQFDRNLKGIGVQNLHLKEIKNVQIPVMPIEMQEKIVKVLDKAQELIDKRKMQIEDLDRLVKSQFIEMFGDPINNPMGWEVKKLKNISTKILSGNTPKGGSEVYVDDGIMFFRSQNVWKNKLVLDDIAYIDKETHKKMLKSSLKHRDILMTKTGRINTENSSLGRASMYLGEDDGANINGHVYLIRLKEEILNEFILFILTSKEYRGYIRSVCVGGIDKRQLNKEHIEEFPIIFPPIEKQKKFVSYVKQVDKLKFETQKSLEEMENNFNSLMQRAFKGELFN